MPLCLYFAAALVFGECPPIHPYRLKICQVEVQPVVTPRRSMFGQMADLRFVFGDRPPVLRVFANTIPLCMFCA